MLDRVSIAAPCSADWESMPGTDRVRHCAQCGKSVYNLSAMTRREAEALLRETQGRLCVRLFRRADGTILTENCPAGLRAIGAKVSRWAGVAMAFSAATIAQFPLFQSALAQEQEFMHAITGVVDCSGLALHDARITIRQDGSEKIYTALSDAKGQFRVESLKAGLYQIAVELQGFSTFRKQLLIGSATELKVNATLMVGSVGGGAAPVEPVPMPYGSVLK